jgi:hypothetical protein
MIPEPTPTPKLTPKPTTNTPLVDQQDMKPFDIPSPCKQSKKRIMEQQAHCYLSFCTLRDFKVLNLTGNGTATRIINNGATPLKVGDVANIR